MELEPQGPSYVPEPGTRDASEGARIEPDPDTVAEIEHPDGSVTRLDGGSVSVLAQLSAPGGDPYVVVHLHEGRSWQRVVPSGDDTHRYELRTATAVAAGSDATFAVIGDPDGGSLVVALAGRVEVEAAAAGRVVLEAHQAVLVAPTGEVALLKALTPDELSRDEWLRVNRMLDEAGRALAAPLVVEATATEEPPAALDAARAPEADAPVRDVVPVSGRGSRRAWAVAAALVVVFGVGAVLSATSNDDGTTVARPGPSRSVQRPAAPTTAAPAPTTTAPAPTTTAPTTTAPTTTTVAPAPTASLQGLRCVQEGSTITYVGALTNTSSVRGTFDVRVAFLDASGREVASARATVADVAPGARREWRASAPAPADLRDSGASCTVTAVEGRAA